MEKLDFRKLRTSHFTAPADEFEQIRLPPTPYLKIDGQGAPGSDAYVAALETLYPAAYALKFHSKNELGRDYVVPLLEGLWWSDKRDAFASNRREEWRWCMMLMAPDWIDRDSFAQVMAELSAKKPHLELSRVRLEVLEEGLCLQKLHIGSFADEAPVLAKLHHELMPSLGLTFNGEHHEIYLNDPRKTAPEKLRTILRQPVRPA